uniref:ALMS motif domain-containing protein n=4 Tax=Ciona intestinalis TaxID=7719 RepID=F6UG30_CIOIN
MPFGPTSSLLSSNNQMSLGSKNKSNSVHFKDVPEVDINPQYMSSYRANTLYINTAQPERQVIGKRNVRITAKNKPTITEDVRSHIPPEPFHVSELNSWNAISSLSPRNKMKDLSKVSEKSKALEKLKEVINFQKHNRSSSDHDISQPTSTDVMNYVHGDMGRKIAVVSAPPVYKGFNEAKTRVRSVVRLNEDETIKSTIKSSNETKRKKESAKVNVTDHRPTARKSRKTGKPTILERNQFSTTPSSWKKGKVIAERILQIPSQKNENFAPDTILRLHQPPAEEPPLSGSSQLTEDHHVTDAQDVPGILSEQTRSILHDIQLTPTKQTRKPMKRRPKPTTLSAHKTKSGAGQKPPKIRHYDRDEVKHYMAGQKLARKKEMLDSMKKQKEAKERKLQQLKMLDEKRKEGRWKTHHEKTQKSYADSVDLTAIS